MKETKISVQVYNEHGDLVNGAHFDFESNKIAKSPVELEYQHISSLNNVTNRDYYRNDKRVNTTITVVDEKGRIVSKAGTYDIGSEDECSESVLNKYDDQGNIVHNEESRKDGKYTSDITYRYDKDNYILQAHNTTKFETANGKEYGESRTTDTITNYTYYDSGRTKSADIKTDVKFIIHEEYNEHNHILFEYAEDGKITSQYEIDTEGNRTKSVNTEHIEENGVKKTVTTYINSRIVIEEFETDKDGNTTLHRILPNDNEQWYINNSNGNEIAYYRKINGVKTLVLTKEYIYDDQGNAIVMVQKDANGVPGMIRAGFMAEGSEDYSSNNYSHVVVLNQWEVPQCEDNTVTIIHE